MDGALWDIKDKAPVILPAPPSGPEGLELLAASKFRQDVELDQYERAVLKMPANLRDRYLRCEASIDVLRAIMIHGRRLGLTKP